LGVKDGVVRLIDPSE